MDFNTAKAKVRIEKKEKGFEAAGKTIRICGLRDQYKIHLQKSKIQFFWVSFKQNSADLSDGLLALAVYEIYIYIFFIHWGFGGFNKFKTHF